MDVRLFEAILRSKQGGSLLNRIGKNVLKHNFCSLVIDAKNKIDDELGFNAWDSDYQITEKDFNIDSLSYFKNNPREDTVCLFVV